MSEQKDTNLWDLVKIFVKWCGKCLVNLGVYFGRQIRMSFRKWYIVMPITFLGIVLGYYFSRYENRIYNAEGVAIVNGPLTSEVKEAMRPLTSALPPHIKPEMALKERLGLSDEQAKGLMLVRSYYVIDCLNDSTPDKIDKSGNHNMSDTLNVISNRYIALAVRTKNLTNLADVENAMVSYLNNNPVLHAKYETHRKVLEEQLGICDNQLQYLDSLSKVFYFNFPQGLQVEANAWSSSMVMGKRSIETLHEDILELTQQRMKIAEELATCVAPVVMINHIAPAPRAVNNRILCLILGCLAGWILSLILAWCIEERQKVSQWLRTK